MGEMVTQDWEEHATQLANADQEDLLTALKNIIEKEAINMSQEANVFVGKDTRYNVLLQTNKSKNWSNINLCVWVE